MSQMRHQCQSKPTSSFSRNSALSVGLRSFDSSRNFRKCFPSEKNKQTTILLKLKNISNQHDNPHTLNQVHFTTNITLPSPVSGSVHKKLSISHGGKGTWQKILEAHHDAKNMVDLWHSVPFWHTWQTTFIMSWTWYKTWSECLHGFVTQCGLLCIWRWHTCSAVCCQTNGCVTVSLLYWPPKWFSYICVCDNANKWWSLTLCDLMLK